MLNFKKIMAGIMASAMVIASFNAFAVAPEVDQRIPGIGDIKSIKVTNNIDGVTVQDIDSDNSYLGNNSVNNKPYGKQDVYTVELTPNEYIKPMIITPEPMYGGQSVKDMVTARVNKGDNVVVAMNGDFFEMPKGNIPHGISHGMMIENGELISTTGGRNHVLVLYDDNTFKYRVPGISGSIVRDGITLIRNTVRLNKDIDGAQDKDKPANVVYTDKYSDSTKTLKNGTEIVAKVENGRIELGKTMQLTVTEVHKDAKDTPIPKGHVVLVSREGSLDKVRQGDKLQLKYSDPGNYFKGARSAISFVDKMIMNGHINNALGGPLGLSARSTIGFKPDGTIVYAACKGSTGHYGMDIKDMTQFLKYMGCDDAFNFDGGGSTQIMVKPDNDKAPEMLNPEYTRKVANAIAFIDTRYIISNVPDNGITTDKMTFEYNYPSDKFKKIQVLKDGEAIQMPADLTFTEKGEYVLNFTLGDGRIVDYSFAIVDENADNSPKIKKINGKDITATGDINFDVTSENVELDIETNIGTTFEIYEDKDLTKKVEKTDDKYVININKLSNVFVKMSRAGIDRIVKITFNDARDIKIESVNGVLPSTEAGEAFVIPASGKTTDLEFKLSGDCKLELYADFNGVMKIDPKDNGTYSVSTKNVYTHYYAKLSSANKNKVVLITLFNDYKAPEFDDEIFSQEGGYWGTPWVELVKDLGIVKGDEGSTKVRPEDTSKRVEGIVMILNLLGVDASNFANMENPFADVTSQWMIPYTNAAYALGITVGYVDDGTGVRTFNPESQITRQDFIVMYARALQLPVEVKGDDETQEQFDARLKAELEKHFKDVDKMAKYAYPSILICKEYGIVDGDKEGNFMPIDALKRIQVMAMIGKTLGAEPEA